jgi:hypothetical protein
MSRASLVISNTDRGWPAGLPDVPFGYGFRLRKLASERGFLLRLPPRAFGVGSSSLSLLMLAFPTVGNAPATISCASGNLTDGKTHERLHTDRLVRERLEKTSPKGERRADVCGMVNGLAARHAAGELPGLASYGLLRMRQAGDAAAVRQHNRAHDEWFGRAAAERPTFADQDDARDQPYVTLLRADRVRDADGALHGGASTEDGANDGSDHWASGRVEPIEAGVEVLTVEQMRVIAGVKARNSRYW